MKYNFLLSRFFRFFLIFVLIIAWLFSGWPRIWQNPRIPLEIKEAYATTERQSPDAIVTQTKLTGTITNIQDDPDSPDANWWSATAQNVATVAHVSFPTPSGNPTTGAGVQEFRVLLRKTAVNNSKTDDTYTIHLYENGVLRQSTIASGGNTPTGGVVVSATWDASNLTNADGSGVEVYIATTPEGSGSPTTRGSIEVGAVEWNVDYTPGLSTAILIRNVADNADVSTITFPAGLPSAVISNPTGNVDVQVLTATASEAAPVAILTSAAAYTLWYNVTSVSTWTDTVASEKLHTIAIAGELDLTTFNTNAYNMTVWGTDQVTTQTLAAGVNKELYLQVTLSALAGKTGTSTLTILGEAL